ncbi:MAG: pyridoxal phosphate-dependent aminotransferase [Microbacteriaceae bacterium]|nr:pyridoxal phosphate-dependent aminotransferase [Microbacteriaceae bacterium]
MSMNPLEQLSLEQLRQRTSMKWRIYPEDVLPLWVAEMDVLQAPAVRDVLISAIERGDTGYPAGNPLGEAVSGFAADRWGWTTLDPERTAIVPDVMMGVVEVLRLITDPGDVVVVNNPVYAPFYAFITNSGRRVVEAPLGADYRIDHDALEATFRSARATGGRAAYLMSNPHNPTGTVHTRDELERVATLARTHGVRVVSDEIHAPLVYSDAQFVPYLSVAGAEDGFALVSASKAWNLAGLKAAIAIAGPEAADDLRGMPEEVSHGPSHLGILAHAAAFTHARDWLDSLLAGLEHNRDLLASLLAEHLPGTRYRAPQGTYLAWFDCRPLGFFDGGKPAGDLAVVSDLEGPARFFLDHARVALSSGHVFGAGGAGFVRLNFATSTEIMTEAVQRMAASIRRLPEITQGQASAPGHESNH